jgi:hypothetical protein
MTPQDERRVPSFISLSNWLQPPVLALSVIAAPIAAILLGVLITVIVNAAR